MKRLTDKKGIALATTLFFVVILYGLASVFVLVSINENRMAEAEREMAKTFYAANGAGQEGLQQMDTLINNYLLNTIAAANPSGVISYAGSTVSSGDGIGWLVNAVRENNVPVLTENGDQAEYSVTGTINGISYQHDITITQKGDPVAVGTDAWDFPYSYVIEASNTSGDVFTTIKYNGDFTVRLQRDSFAKYALFTNTQETPLGSKVWFTDKTNFAGPVHTNDRFNFARNPSGIFEQNVTQYEDTARFYNNGSNILLDADYNGTKDVPVFNDGFDRDESYVTLSSATQEADMVGQATGGNTYSSNGIYVPNNGTTLTGGIYVKGDSNVTMSVDGSNNPVYTIVQSGTTQQITVNNSTQETTVVDIGAGTSTTYSGIPNGVDDAGTVIYVDGNIDNLSGTVQADTAVTIASNADIVINDHIRYENYTPAVGSPGDASYVPANANGTDNLLGIVSWQGDVRIGTSAPDNVDIHGNILAKDGILQVDNYSSSAVGPRGTATLLGGVITDNYGAFGTFSGSSGAQLSGYGRNFVYDERMGSGYAPPYFPTLNTFIAFTNDITDKIVWKEGE